MNKEKQIEEMARIIGHCESTLHPDIECHNKATGCYCIENPCHNQRIADKLYTAGYRKQEWISVEDRLPTHKDGKVLIYTAYGISIAERTVNNRWRGDCAIPKLITHWMLLPEAPKMKGGAE